ncbi:MAG: TonB-dependent receptor plug domain-containing protein [Bacteroidetes bacterium]|nr:TonB-dependent receptor plug domain-containing protein [Bacteroidota bacterium]
MNRKLQKKIYTFIITFWVGVNGFGAQIIKGKITDNTTGTKVSGANIEQQNTGKTTTTDTNGIFQLELKIGEKIIVSAEDYVTTEFVVPDNINGIWEIKIVSIARQIGAVFIHQNRLKEKLRESPVTVESLNAQAIRETPASDFYEALGHLKGVDLTTASMGFKVINTRGFNSTSPVRSLQLIDGVDNQAPGLNFSLGNFLGACELDIQNVELVVGASSAYYGPNAFNGVISMTTKNPWKYRGLSAQLKLGERDLGQIMIRYADVIKNKKGEEKFAYKANIYYMRAYDWPANNMNPTSNSLVGINNPGGYDAINRYGDEALGFQPSPYGRRIDRSGLEYYYRTGYAENQIINYNTKNLKGNLFFAYKINNNNELQVNSNFGTGSTVYQGDNRYRLEDVLFFQNRLEWVGKKGFLRFYSTHEDAGKTYDIVLTSYILNNTNKTDESWRKEYAGYWSKYMNDKAQALPGFPSDPFDPKFDSLYAVYLQRNHKELQELHQQTRPNADLKSANYDSEDRYIPGTMRFDSMRNLVIGRRGFDKDGRAMGSRFYDRSSLYHVNGERKFKFRDYQFVTGFSSRLYRPNSLGTLFLDTNGRRINNHEFGIYAGIEKRFWEQRMKVNITCRVDKNQNFNYLYSPAASLIYSKTKKHTFRISTSSALRNPTLQDQYLNYNIGPAILRGNLDGFKNVYTLSSWITAVGSLNPKALDTFDVDPLKPEKVKTFECNYKGFYAGGRVAIDAGVYYSLYRDFIGFMLVVDGAMDRTTGIPKYAQVYRVAANSKSLVSTQGATIGVNYFFLRFYTLNANWSYNVLDRKGLNDKLIPAFNTPKNKFNISIGASNLNGRIHVFNKNLNYRNIGFNINYKYVQGFLFEGSPQFSGKINSYKLIDAQFSKQIEKWKSTIKIGATNLLNTPTYQVYGGPAIGRMAYISFTYEPN